MKTSIKSAFLAGIISVGANASEWLENQDCNSVQENTKNTSQIVNCTKENIELVLLKSEEFETFQNDYELFINQNNLQNTQIIIESNNNKNETQKISKDEFFDELKLQNISQEMTESLERIYNKAEQNISASVLVSAWKSIIRLEQNNYKTKLEKLADIYLILTAVKPENTIFSLEFEWTKLSLPILENISTVNALLHKKIPQSEVQGYEEMYAKWFEEYREKSLAEVEEKLSNPKFLAKSIKRRGEKAWIIDGDTEEIMYEKIANYMLARYEKWYDHTMSKLYSYTEWDPIRWINQFQERAPETILQWDNLDWGFEVAYQGLVIEQEYKKSEEEYKKSLKDLEADKRMTEAVLNLAAPFSDEEK